MPLEVGVAEGRGHIDDGAGLVALGHVLDAHKALHIGQSQGEEGGVHRADHQTVVAVGVGAGPEGQKQQRLLGEPLQSLGL